LVLRSTDVFAVRRITAMGVDKVTREQIVSATAGVMGKSLLSVSTSEVKKALLGLPGVEAVEVNRAFPNTLEIELAEYRPVARILTGGTTLLVSDAGRVLDDAGPLGVSELPMLVPDASYLIGVGEKLPEALLDVLPLVEYVRSAEMRAKVPNIKQIAISAAGCAALILEDGGELRLGTPENIEQKLGVALDIVQKCLAQGRLIEYIDASVANRVAVKAK
jgi:cell division septal protein FtsQ